MFFIATQRVTSARWSAGLRRDPRGVHVRDPGGRAADDPADRVRRARTTLYPWSRPGAFARRARDRRQGALPARAVRLRAHRRRAAIWVAVRAGVPARVAARRTRPTGAGLRMHRRLDRLGAAFVVVFALTITLAAYDWLVSLDPELVQHDVRGLRVRGHVRAGHRRGHAGDRRARRAGNRCAPSVGEHQLHDLGKLLFAFSIFWAYIWVCQYLLIWYGNIPEEVTHYVTRTNGGWLPLFVANVLINWVVPFLGLLSARAKQDPRRLGVIAVRRAGRPLARPLPGDHARRVARSRTSASLEPLIAAGYAALVVLLFRFTSRARRWCRSTIPCWPPTRPAVTTSSGGTPHDQLEEHRPHERRQGRDADRHRAGRGRVRVAAAGRRDRSAEPDPGGGALRHRRGAGLPAALRGVLADPEPPRPVRQLPPARSSTSGTGR